jgi:hypothetical protein
VELTDPKIIDALRGEVQRRRKSRQTKMPEGKPDRKRRCLCGICPVCLDNARWEAIFNAKFADPDYYKPRPVRGASSLDWIRPASKPSSIRSFER